jgi:uroporphyrinogen-III synthase
MNLRGLRILNTRPLHQGLELHEAIANAHGISIQLPMLAIEPTSTDWLHHLPDLYQVQQAIFISTNAVNFFFKALNQPWPKTIKTITIGKASAQTLQHWGINHDESPPIADSHHLLQIDSLQNIRQQTILLVKGKHGRTEIEDNLIKRGALLVPLDVYERVLPHLSSKYVQSLWHDGQVDIILITSEQSLQHLLMMFGEQAKAWIMKTPCMVISERLEKAALNAGMQKVLVSRYDAILSSLQTWAELKDNEHDDRKNNPTRKKTF